MFKSPEVVLVREPVTVWLFKSRVTFLELVTTSAVSTRRVITSSGSAAISAFMMEL